MTVKTQNINDTFFEGIYKEVWRKLIPNGLSEAECEFIVDVADLKPTDRVLDLMCGYGRHAIPLSQQGMRLTALDIADDYISEIKETAKTNRLPIEAETCGALDAKLSGHYKAILCMGNSFAFFDRNDAIQLLKKISAHLEDEGTFIINSWMIAEIAIRHFKEKEWCEVDGYKYMMDYRFQFHPSRIESEHTIVGRDRAVEVISGVDYIFTLSELEVMFQEAGLTTQGLFSTPRKRPFRMGDNRVYIVVGKK
jgi:cyclopropane fatty-acyl-phospholipid synthase-like methyltransferase